MLRRQGLAVLALGLAGCSGLVRAGSYDEFFSAVERNDARTIQALVQRGFDPNTVDPKGRYALMIALGDNSMEAAKAILAAPGVKVEVRNASDESPLMLAALRGNLDMVQALVAKDADVNKTGWTPLHYAATTLEGDPLKVVAFLIENFAYIDATSPGGTTPLMMAAYYGKIDTVTLLLSEGADPFLRNNKQLTAIDMAKQADRKEVADLIAETIRRKAASAAASP